MAHTGVSGRARLEANRVDGARHASWREKRSRWQVNEAGEALNKHNHKQNNSQFSAVAMAVPNERLRRRPGGTIIRKRGKKPSAYEMEYLRGCCKHDTVCCV